LRRKCERPLPGRGWSVVFEETPGKRGCPETKFSVMAGKRGIWGTEKPARVGKNMDQEKGNKNVKEGREVI